MENYSHVFLESFRLLKGAYIIYPNIEIFLKL